MNPTRDKLVLEELDSSDLQKFKQVSAPLFIFNPYQDYGKQYCQEPKKEKPDHNTLGNEWITPRHPSARYRVQVEIRPTGLFLS